MTKEQKRKIERLLNNSIDSLTPNELIEKLEEVISKLEPNIILLSDAYKYSHPDFYTEGLTYLKSYLESRGGRFSETVMFGTQYIVKKFFVGQVLSTNMIDEADKKLNSENGTFNGVQIFPKEKWLKLLDKHNGVLPLKIRAVREGTVVPTKNVLLTIENTDDEFAWLTNFVESLILQIWYPITVATLSRECKKVVKDYLIETGTKPKDVEPLIQYIINNFGFRGVSSVESATIGGMAHYVNFLGCDDVIASDTLMKYYGAKYMYGKSIPATEHSICTIEGEEGELNTFKRCLTTHPSGVVACISDSYNIIRACETYWGTILKNEILQRNGTLVIRLDSGHPVQTIKRVMNILFDKFGYSKNDKGFKVLPPQVRIIQSDGVNYDSIIDIYNMFVEEKISAENMFLGMGGKLLQAGIDRDLFNFAIKACYGIINDRPVNIVKNPLEIDENGNTQVSFKKSKKGDVKLVTSKIDGSYRTITSDNTPDFDNYRDELVTIFENGILIVDDHINMIRERAIL